VRAARIGPTVWDDDGPMPRGALEELAHGHHAHGHGGLAHLASSGGALAQHNPTDLRQHRIADSSDRRAPRHPQRFYRATPLPYRVLDLNVYGWSILMVYGIPQVLGYHGTELRAYDDLLGGKNEWRNLNQAQLWRLLAIRYILVGDSVNVPGYHHVLGPVVNALGRRTYLYEADSPPPYVRVIPAAVKGEADRIIPTLLDPRLDYDRLVLFAPDEPVNPLPVDSMPHPSPARAQVAAWEPGRMTITLDPPPPERSYVLVAENWYLDWHATVDGVDAPVLRGDQTFITVPVPAGARRLELVYRSSRYRLGRMVSILATLIVAGFLVGPPLTKRFAPGLNHG